MNRDEAKNILLLYRHGTTDVDGPETVEALALAKREPELARWLEEHCARQFVLRDRFRQIPIPAGLKEQIISEQAAERRRVFWRKTSVSVALAVLVLLVVLVPFWSSHNGHDDTLAIYQNRMASIALRGYAMDLATNNAEEIRAFLSQNHAPADFVLPAALKQVALTGCAVEGWQNVKVSMICFRTGKPSSVGESSDLWLFVVDRASVRDVPARTTPLFSKANRLTTAIWTDGDKLYLLGTEGDEQTIKHYL